MVYYDIFLVYYWIIPFGTRINNGTKKMTKAFQRGFNCDGRFFWIAPEP